MKIGFMDFLPWDYDVGTVRTRPLGGSQSAASYLAVELARRGHQVFYLNHAKQAGMVEGVAGMPWNQVNVQVLRGLGLEVAVSLMTGLQMVQLSEALGPGTKKVMWSGHPDHEPSVQYLADRRVHELHDGFVFVSRWQALRYQQVFGIAPGKMAIIGNAVAPAFEGMFGTGESIGEAKEEPAVLAFTSVPQRGLEYLLDVFPEIRAAVPGTRLKAYSSMGLYMTEPRDEPADCLALYERARRMEGVEYMGMVPQAELARGLRGVSLLAYCCPVAETSCISVMEAMAAGCQVVTTDVGALGETTAGYGALVRPEPETYRSEFVGYVVERLKRRQTAETEARLREQVAFVNREYTWAGRALQWEGYLSRLIGR